MDNVGEENTPIGEEHMDDTLPSVIEKEKKPRKKRETHSPAQLETLKRGREKLAQKRQKQREAKKKTNNNEQYSEIEIHLRLLKFKNSLFEGGLKKR